MWFIFNRVVSWLEKSLSHNVYYRKFKTSKSKYPCRFPFTKNKEHVNHHT